LNDASAVSLPKQEIKEEISLEKQDSNHPYQNEQTNNSPIPLLGVPLK